METGSRLITTNGSLSRHTAIYQDIETGTYFVTLTDWVNRQGGSVHCINLIDAETCSLDFIAYPEKFIFDSQIGLTYR